MIGLIWVVLVISLIVNWKKMKESRNRAPVYQKRIKIIAIALFYPTIFVSIFSILLFIGNEQGVQVAMSALWFG